MIAVVPKNWTRKNITESELSYPGKLSDGPGPPQYLIRSCEKAARIMYHARFSRPASLAGQMAGPQ